MKIFVSWDVFLPITTCVSQFIPENIAFIEKIISRMGLHTQFLAEQCTSTWWMHSKRWDIFMPSKDEASPIPENENQEESRSMSLKPRR